MTTTYPSRRLAGKEWTWESVVVGGLSILSQIAKHTVCHVLFWCISAPANFIFSMALEDRYCYCLHLPDEETGFQGGTVGGNGSLWERAVEL